MRQLQRKLRGRAAMVLAVAAAASCAVPEFNTSLGDRDEGGGGDGNAQEGVGGTDPSLAGNAGAPTQSGGSVGESGGAPADAGGSVGEGGGSVGDTGGTGGQIEGVGGTTAGAGGSDVAGSGGELSAGSAGVPPGSGGTPGDGGTVTAGASGSCAGDLCGSECVDVQADPNNCGACGTTCGADQSCVSGTCACAPGEQLCGSTCTDTQANVGHCGFCGNECVADADGHVAEVACQGGDCTVTGCLGRYEDCDGAFTNGCEADLDTHVEHCDACNSACPTTAGTPQCLGGVCGYSNCSDPLADCDADDSCETDVSTDATHCDGCNRPCATAHGTPVCQDASCSMTTCESGWEDCSLDENAVRDGCETNVANDATNCGDCGVVCSEDVAILHPSGHMCDDGNCVASGCESNWGSCDTTMANGCEVYLPTSVDDCGRCGYSCSANAPPNTHTTGCSLGACLYECDNDYDYCDASGTDSDGCEVYLPTGAPNTTVDVLSADLESTSAEFDFGCVSAGCDPCTFECQLDGDTWTECSSPASYPGLQDGTHTFRVRATNSLGIVDTTPTEHAWPIDTPPDTIIDSCLRIPPSNPQAIQFTFSSTQPPSTFECRCPSSSGWGSCSSGTAHVCELGTMPFEVRAIDQGSKVDPTPATHDGC